jgi:4-amino-4-deoxy-L-arabinose transferase-like glycosyltransferase
MAAEVGGRLETVAPRRSLFGPDYVRIGVLLVVAAGVHGWLVAHTAVPARDSLGYARIAFNFADPNGLADPNRRPDAEPDAPRPRIEVIRTAEQPPGFPVAVWATGKLLKHTTNLPDPDRGLLATQIANAIAAVLLVVPVYLTGRILLGRNVGFAAALLFQVLPVPARVTSDGLSEGVYLLVVAVAILLGVRAARRPGIGGFLLCGMATGASYLVRPEGLMVAVAVAVVIVAPWVARRWTRDVALGRLTALLVGVALVGLPYMVLIGKLSNKPTEDYLTNPFNNQPNRIWPGQPGTRAPVGGAGPLFAEWWDPARDEGKCRELWAVGAVWREVIKALHYVVAALALFGLIAHRRQLFAPDRGMWVLVILGTLNLLLLVYLATRMGYVSERHTVLLVLLACILAAAALEPLAQAVEELPRLGRLVVWPKAAPAGMLLALVAGALPYTLKTMHPQREGHKHAGQWLATHMKEGDWLVDPFTWAEWYAGRTLYKTVRYEGQPATGWTVLESEKKPIPHSRLPQWEEALKMKANGTLAYHWPEDVPPEDAAVLVYRVDYKPPPPAPPPKKPKADPPKAP